MRKYIITLIVLFQAVTLIAQKDNRIKYVLPDNVEVLIDSCLKKAEGNKMQFYFLLAKDSIYNIAVGRYSKKEEKNILKWVRQSNRYVVVNKKTYPLIFDYDLKFATVDSNIGEFGNREGNIKRISLMLHGITIYFKPDGTIIKIENW